MNASTTERGPARLGRGSAATNLAAQGSALAALSLASLIVARWGGPAVLGEYALLRVLPWLTGVVVSAGLPIAATYHLAGRGGTDPALRSTLTVLVVAGSVLGTVAWVLGARTLDRLFFPHTAYSLLLLAAPTVVTQLVTVWGKACCQGLADMRGANVVIVAEELLFLPAYGLVHLAGFMGIEAVIIALVGGGAAAATVAVGRLVAIGFFRGWGTPSVCVAREVVVFGARGQVGNLLWLVNLRLDFLILGALAGPAVLGVYAVGSKFAELLRLPTTAANYVLYPRFARSERTRADAELRHILPRAVLATMAAAPLLALGAVAILPVLYGDAFQPAVLPACVLLVGLAVEGGAAVASAYLWGVGRPGANSIAMGVGVVLTVALDLLLIPSHGALGAAVASSAAYLATTTVLVGFARRFAGSGGP